MSATARGRLCPDGPLTFCDNADVHRQPCLCAALFGTLRISAADRAAFLSSVPVDLYWPEPGSSDEDQPGSSPARL